MTEYKKTTVEEPLVCSRVFDKNLFLIYSTLSIFIIIVNHLFFCSDIS